MLSGDHSLYNILGGDIMSGVICLVAFVRRIICSRIDC